MVNVLVLAMLDFSKEFIIEIDALGSELGAVLMQDGRSVAFLSMTFSPQNRSKLV